MFAFEWTSWYGLLVTLASGIVTIGAALAVASGGAKRLAQIVRPSEPLVSFGHPVDDTRVWRGGKFVRLFPPLLFDPSLRLRKHVSKEESKRLQEEHEKNKRLWESNFEVSYRIENKDSVPLRGLSTGIRTRKGRKEETFRTYSVQILSPGETTEVTHARVPRAMHRGMTNFNRVDNFFYWVRFQRAGWRWEGIYDPKSRELTYRRLRRRW